MSLDKTDRKWLVRLVREAINILVYALGSGEQIRFYRERYKEREEAFGMISESDL